MKIIDENNTTNIDKGFLNTEDFQILFVWERKKGNGKK